MRGDRATLRLVLPLEGHGDLSIPQRARPKKNAPEGFARRVSASYVRETNPGPPSASTRIMLLFAPPVNSGDRLAMAGQPSARRIAEVAQQVAMENWISIGFQGLLIQHLLHALLAKGVFTKDELTLVFFNARRAIEQPAEQPSESQRAAARSMLELCDRVSQAFGLNLEDVHPFPEDRRH
jgi:hypothetical protein